LALGDALLAADGSYHWDCRERAHRLQLMDSKEFGQVLPRALIQHAEGVQFKLHPIRTSKPIEEFRFEHRKLTELALGEWLCIENRRLKANFSTLREYSLSNIDKCADSVLWRNLLLNLRTFGAGATLDPNSPRYPRQRLLRA